jgi:hypothetical protein
MKEFKHVPDSRYSKYAAPKIVYIDGMRQYSINDGEIIVPTITSVLSAMMSSEGLDKWRERVGEDVANHICQSAINRGNKFHKICEAYIGNSCICKFENYLLEFGMFECAQPALDRISDIVGIELPMVSKELGIGGTADIIAKFDGVLSIIDLKSSTSPKKEEWCKKFFLQETAYSLMFEEVTSRPIEQLVTIIVSEDGTVQVLIRNRDDFTQELKGIISQYQTGKVCSN